MPLATNSAPTVDALRQAIRTLHEVGNLVHASLELQATMYGVLTGVTAGVGLGLNRAMIFRVVRDHPTTLVGTCAVGPVDRAEADRVWKDLEAGQADLKALYDAGIALRAQPGALDVSVRRVRLDQDGTSLVSLAHRTQALSDGSTPGVTDLDGLLHLPTAVAAPLRGRGCPLGVLYADNRFNGRTLSGVMRDVFSMVADHAALAIETAERHEQLARSARTDALTGLPHHGAMMETAAAAYEADATAQLGFAMVDLDGFKQINDHLGHLAGDTLLAAVAERLRQATVDDEQLFRYGGEEFGVLIPSLGDAASTGERFRRAIAERPFVLSGTEPVPVTCSVGVAGRRAGVISHVELIAAADQALLQAKADGKDRVVVV